MKTFDEIYSEIIFKDDTIRYSLRELLHVFQTENSWIGQTSQLLQLKEFQHELTGIRPGGCSGCNIEVLMNMIRWVNKYESDKAAQETKKIGRPKRNG
jgi:hypothetical protein